MSPLPSTKVIPTDWSTRHAPAAAGGMNAHCTIRDPATDTTGWDPTTESSTVIPGPAVYDGPCCIQRLKDARTVPQADEQVAAHEYLVQILFDAAAPREGWILTPHDVIHDPDLNGRPLYIVDPQLGSERFTRDLVVTDTNSQ